jgi:hypothetical protein
MIVAGSPGMLSGALREALQRAKPLVPSASGPMGRNMSSGPFTYALSAAAAFVLRSLTEHPELRTADEIAAAPQARGEIDAAGARDGLRELGDHGLATEDADGRWQLTESGRQTQTA